MKRMLKNVVLVGSVMAAGIAAADFGGDWSPIVGIDYKWSTSNHSNQGFNGGRGRSRNGASVYLGSRFCENFGLELGYDWSSRRSSTTTLTAAPVPAFGTIPAGSTFTGTVASSSRHSQWRLDLNGYMPIGCCEGFDLIGSIGIASARTRVSFAETGVITTPAGVTTATTAAGNFSGSRSRFAWRLGVGAQYMVSCNVGVRAMYRYETLAGHRHTSTFTGFGSRHRNSGSAVTLGLFYQF